MMASEFAVNYITRKLESLPLTDVYMPSVGKSDISRFLYFQPWKSSPSLDFRQPGSFGKNKLCHLDLNIRSKVLNCVWDLGKKCPPNPNTREMLPTFRSVNQVSDDDATSDCRCEKSDIDEKRRSDDLEISSLSSFVSSGSSRGDSVSDCADLSRALDVTPSRFAPVLDRPEFEIGLHPLAAAKQSPRRDRSQHPSPVRFSPPASRAPVTPCETTRKLRRSVPTPLASDSSPIISRALPTTRSPNKRKRNSDSLSSDVTLITQSCDSEVSEICSDSVCNTFPRTSSFDEELLTSGRFRGFAIPDWAANGAASRSLKRLRQRPSVSGDRLRSFSVVQPNTSHCRKIKVLEVNSAERIQESLGVHPADLSKDALAIIHSDRVFRPIPLVVDGST